MKYETKAKIADFYIKTRNYFFKGQSEFMVLKGVVQLFILIDLMLIARFSYKAPIPILIIAGMGVSILFWAGGKFWDVHKLFDREAEFGNLRNEFVKEVRKKLK